MKRQVIYIPDYDWVVYIFYDTTKNDAVEVSCKLYQIGCSPQGIGRSYRQLMKGIYNNGMTYSNRSLRESVVSLGRASEFPQFLNSFVHELQHLSTHIAMSSDIPLDGEDICYLSGWLAQRMYPILIHYITKCYIS